MGIIIEILLIGFIVGGMIFGFARGFIRSVARPVRIFAAFFIAILCAAPIGNHVIQPIVQKPMENRIAVSLSESGKMVSEEDLPTVIKLSASLCRVDLSEYIGESGEETAEKLASAVSDPVCSLFSRIVAFVILFAVVSLVVRFLIFLIDMIFQNGPLDVLNRLLGFVFATALSVVIAWGFCALFGFILSTDAFREFAWVKNFKGGAVYRFFKSFDPIEMLLSF